jgi:tRNA(Ile)-lysidine synthase TilS/MesJ
MTKCDKCHSLAVIYQRYSGMHLCREHFEEDVNRKIREALRKTGLFGSGSRIVVGLDGGRKSATSAFVLKNLFIRRRDIDLLAVIIDEGKKTSPTADQARNVAERLKIPYVVKNMPILPGHEQSYHYHYVRRTEMLFCTAEENGAGVLATGEDLDDEALEIFIGYLRGDVDAVVSGGFPASPAGSGSEKHKISWIKPMRRIPEKEVRLYAIGHHLGFVDAGEKTYVDAFRSAAKRQLFGFDCRHPGTNYSLLRGLEKGLAQERVGKGKAFK